MRAISQTDIIMVLAPESRLLVKVESVAISAIASVITFFQQFGTNKTDKATIKREDISKTTKIDLEVSSTFLTRCLAVTSIGEIKVDVTLYSSFIDDAQFQRLLDACSCLDEDLIDEDGTEYCDFK